MKSSKSFVLNNSGQGLIEYVLILVVSVTIVLGALYQLNQAFRVFADNYFGDYLTCLLESGELPALGGNTPGECNQEYKEFSLKDGRSLVGGDVGEGSESGSSGEGEETTADEASRARAVSTGGSQRFSAGGNAFSRSNRFRRGSGRGSAGGDAEASSDMSTGASGYVASAGGSSQTVVVRIPVNYNSRDRNGRRVKEKNDDNKKSMKVASKTDDSPEVQRQKLLPVKRKLTFSDEAPEIEEFTFGNFLKYLIIAIIIIAIVVVVGGELRQVSKSME